MGLKWMNKEIVVLIIQTIKLASEMNKGGLLKLFSTIVGVKKFRGHIHAQPLMDALINQPPDVLFFCFSLICLFQATLLFSTPLEPK